ncbi:MAG: PIG-L family deacetylase [Myxococcales bacterium]|nr:PIG-L family deacetylase [Myxococcales bacterium]
MLVAIPDPHEATRVLAVQPHYDDNDIGAGGTLAALREAGAELCYLTVTDDLVGVLDPELSDAEARSRLRAEQKQAADAIGGVSQSWLDYPDAGDYDYYELRTQVIREIRRVRPDFVFTVDPWLPYEAHRDHTRVGRAVAEAVLLYRLPRLATDPEVDRDYEGHAVRGIAFYFTARGNTVIDISQFRERKHRALDAYRSQFTPDGLRELHAALEWKERSWAEDEPFSHGESLTVLAPRHLHVNPDADEMAG